MTRYIYSNNKQVLDLQVKFILVLQLEGTGPASPQAKRRIGRAWGTNREDDGLIPCGRWIMSE